MLRLPAEIRSGTPQANVINQIIRALRSLEPQTTVDNIVSIGPRGTAIQGVRKRKAVTDSTSAIQRFKILNSPLAVDAGDYIACVTWDGTNLGTETINVAKPWELRRSTLHDQTRGGESFSYETNGMTRTVTHLSLGTGVTSQEVLWPQYIQEDEIIAFQPNGGTGVYVADTTGTARQLVWEDVNIGARTFVHPYQLTTVCVGGVERRIVVRRGNLT